MAWIIKNEFSIDETAELETAIVSVYVTRDSKVDPREVTAYYCTCHVRANFVGRRQGQKFAMFGIEINANDIRRACDIAVTELSAEILDIADVWVDDIKSNS